MRTLTFVVNLLPSVEKFYRVSRGKMTNLKPAERARSPLGIGSSERSKPLPVKAMQSWMSGSSRSSSPSNCRCLTSGVTCPSYTDPASKRFGSRSIEVHRYVRKRNHVQRQQSIITARAASMKMPLARRLPTTEMHLSALCRYHFVLGVRKLQLCVFRPPLVKLW